MAIPVRNRLIVTIAASGAVMAAGGAAWAVAPSGLGVPSPTAAAPAGLMGAALRGVPSAGGSRVTSGAASKAATSAALRASMSAAPRTNSPATVSSPATGSGPATVSGPAPGSGLATLSGPATVSGPAPRSGLAATRSSNPAVVGPLVASGAAMVGALPPIGCQMAAAQIASQVYGQAPVRNAVLPVVVEVTNACEMASGAGSAGLTQAGAAMVPASAVNPAVNPTLDIAAAGETAVAGQLPAGANAVGPGPADLAPVITYLKGS